MIPQSINEWLFTANLFGSIAILLVVTAIPLVRRAFGSRAAFVLWTVVLIRLLVPAFPTVVSIPHSKIPDYRVSAWVSDTPRESVSTVSSTVVAAPAKVAENPWLIVWLVGVGLTMMPAFAGVCRSLQIRHRSLDVTERIRREVPELPRRVRVLASADTSWPALCGLFLPMVLLPAGCLERFSTEQLRCVILHEIGHFRRGDLLWRWAFLLARSVHWFNPLVWWAERRSRIDQELACDEWVLSRESMNGRVYGEALLAVTQMVSASRLRPLQVSMAESSRGLERRLNHAATNRRRGVVGKILVIAATVGIAVVLGPVRVIAADSKAVAAEFVPADAGAMKTGGDFVEIESKFIGLPPSVANDVLRATSERGTSILRADALHELLQRIDRQKGVDLLSMPKVAARSGQRAVINMIREFRYPTQYDADPDVEPGVTPSHFETRNLGVTLEVEPVLGSGNRIDLTIAPQVVEFMGFVNYGADHPARNDGTDPLAAALATQFDASHAINQPVFDVRKTMTSVTIKSGETVVLGGLRKSSGSFQDMVAGKLQSRHGTDQLLFVLVTARRPDASGMKEPAYLEPHPTPTPDPTPASGELPYGTLVEGKPGFVTSPYAPDAGYVDVRGFPANTEVKCPYSGKLFLVP